MDIWDEMRKSVQSTSNRSKAYEMLNADEKRKVDEWVKALQKEQKLTSATISSYKSYVCNGIISLRNGQKLTNDQKSAFRKFLSFLDK